MRTEIPIPICAADGEHSTAGITSSKSPKVRKRTARGSLIDFLCPGGLAEQAAPRAGKFRSKKFRCNRREPELWPKKYFFTLKRRGLESVLQQGVVLRKEKPVGELVKRCENGRFYPREGSASGLKHRK